MARMININKKVTFELKPLSNKIQILYEEDFKNWIGFSMQLKTLTECIGYSEEDCMMLSVSEVKNILNRLNNILSKEDFFEYYSIERFFDLFIRKCKYEADVYETELWINMGTYTDGKEYGYDKGFKFYINKDTLQNFYNNLYDEIIGVNKNVLS